MISLDPLRPVAEDSFARAAQAIRTASPRPSRRRRVLAAVALAALVGACATPVETVETVGTVISWTVYGSADPGHYTVRPLDEAVPARQRLGLETQPAERPTLPPGHPDSPKAGWTRIRYTTSATHPDSVAALRGLADDVIGVYGIAVEPLVHAHRLPLVAVATRSIRSALQPGAPDVTDRDLQRYLEAHLERMDLPANSEWRRRAPQIERLADGRRILNRGHSAFVLTPETRIWIRPDDPEKPVDFFGVGYDDLLLQTTNGWKTSSELGFPDPFTGD